MAPLAKKVPDPCSMQIIKMLTENHAVAVAYGLLLCDVTFTTPTFLS